MEHDSSLTIITAGDSISLILNTCGEFSVLSAWNALRTAGRTAGVLWFSIVWFKENV